MTTIRALKLLVRARKRGDRLAIATLETYLFGPRRVLR